VGGLILALRVLRVGLVGLVMAYGATGNGSQLSMAHHMPGDCPDDRALNAPLGDGAFRRNNSRHAGETERRHRPMNEFHSTLLQLPDDKLTKTPLVRPRLTMGAAQDLATNFLEDDAA
jgi:hypothetical protein